ncbi:MAG: MBL fold metallo-hydrolase [Oscillospiraceae bacterium]|nr:MBL fold metallo-hydrolase [Oscillospiraceae bacterium]
MIRLTVLCENTPPVSRALGEEHGLSYWIETEHGAVLFDCGQSGLAFENAEKLHLPLSKAAYVVLSHSHYDHAGGYPVFAGVGLTCPLVTGEGFFEEKYAQKKDSDVYSYLGCGFGPELLEHYGVRRLICGETLELLPGLWAVGGFARETAYEEIPPRFQKNWPAPQPDLFEDEICLAAKTQEGLAVFCGCGHPGIVNMLTAVQKHFGLPIVSVTGGAHLAHASQQRVTATAQALRQMEVKRLYLGHCTGEACSGALREEGLVNLPLAPGDCVAL